jgi:hypothetical protein
MRRPWYGKKELWIALGLVLAMAFMLFDAWRDGSSRVASSVERSDAEVHVAASDPEILDAVAETSGSLVTIDSAPKESRSSESKTPAECKRAPIRGCAPSKDDRGCYHCTRCWRPYHYDVEHPPNAISFSCQEMPDAALYVELTESAEPIVPQRWLVSVSFDGRRVDQRVSPNLGGAFYADFHGGTIELTATLQSCDGPSTSCQGDVDVVVNAKPEERR